VGVSGNPLAPRAGVQAPTGGVVVVADMPGYRLILGRAGRRLDAVGNHRGLTDTP